MNKQNTNDFPPPNKNATNAHTHTHTKTHTCMQHTCHFCQSRLIRPEEVVFWMCSLSPYTDFRRLPEQSHTGHILVSGECVYATVCIYVCVCVCVCGGGGGGESGLWVRVGMGWKEDLNSTTTSVLGWGGGKEEGCVSACVCVWWWVCKRVGSWGGGGDKWNASEIVPTWNDHARLCLHVVLFPGPLGELLVS